ncbi:MAG TPA: error-prone DNA polymerase, partial [Burkholderiales bacterium]
LTDECSVAGVVRAHVEAKKRGFKLIVGSEIRFANGPNFVFLAQDREGYGNLCALITKGRRNADKGSYRLQLDDAKHLPHCLALLIPDMNEKDEASAAWLVEHFPGRAWIAVELLRGADDHAQFLTLQRLGLQFNLPLVAAGDVHMHERARQMLQDTLCAIRLGKPVHECGHELFPNGERHLRLRAELSNLYPPDLLEQTLRIAAQCNFSLAELRYEYPDETLDEGETVRSRLHKEVREGLLRRYPQGTPPAVAHQIVHELQIIAAKNYEPYFLTVLHIVNFARSRNILCQGRGSSANSAVCYALGITSIDPNRSNMLFERFISMARDEPPDIDVDFEHDRREEVIQYIYEHYGRDRAALAATVICYRKRSAVRDVGKALGFDGAQVDQLAKSIAWWDKPETLRVRLLQAGIDPQSTKAQLLFTLTAQLCGFPRHLSQHVGGFVISRGPLSQLVPIENASMINRSVIQWEKNDLEAIGLMKVDVLALGMLSVIRRAFNYINARDGCELNLATIPEGDQAVYKMIQRADTVGVFQIESRAQMSMLPRLRPENYYDLVVQVAIVRPGPIQGGMVHPYLAAREKLRKGEKIDFAHPELEPVLGRTLGVPIFQEQVMQLVITAAGFSADRADQLRRAMAAWHRRGSMDKFEQELLAGMQQRNYSEAFAKQIWSQICGFGEYGFPESHSASFALLAYCSSWLKHHHPAAFLAALLNSQPMGFYSPAQLLHDARRHDIEVRPVDVAHSDWDCTLEDEAVRLGLRQIKGLSEKGAERLVRARAQAPFSNIADLSSRAELGQSDLQALAGANAFGPLSAHRRDALWQVAGVDNRPLLRGLPERGSKPALRAPTEGEDIWADYAHVGLSLGRHPLALLRSRLKRMKVLSAEELHHCPPNTNVWISGLVTGRQRPGDGNTIFVTLEDESGNTNVIVWHRVAEAQREALLSARLLSVWGTVERSSGVTHLIARKLRDHSALLGDLDIRSRDFH